MDRPPAKADLGSDKLFHAGQSGAAIHFESQFLGTYSILHWLVLVGLFCLLGYGIFRAMKRPLSNAQGSNDTFEYTGEQEQPAGFGGWLIFLVLSLIFIGPLLGTLALFNQFMSAELQYPDLKALGRWHTVKSACWWMHVVIVCLSIFAGVGLLKRRDFAVVRRAKIILWLLGPGTVVAMGFVLPFIVFGTLPTALESLGTLLASAISPAIWTAYLSKSRRVRATYGSALPKSFPNN